jgi:hypothetical protein
MLRRVLIGLCACLALAALETAQAWARMGLNDALPPLSWLPRLYFNTLRAWLVLGALSPLPLLLARHFPPLRPPLARTALVHVAGAVGFFALHVGLFALALLPGATAPFEVLLVKLFTSYAALDLLVYAALVGGVEALRLSHEAEARAVQAAQLEASLGQARLEALRARLHPHFLFNAMNAFSTLALAGRGAEVAEGLSRLAGLLRAALDDRLAGEIPLARELELADAYLDVERLRFAERLRVVRDVEPATLAARVPSLILQPLLENALRHGLGPRPAGGTVTLRARVESGQLTLAIEDDGVGCAAAMAEGTGLGLVRERLQRSYGRAHQFEIGTREGGGTAVWLRLPLTTA